MGRMDWSQKGEQLFSNRKPKTEKLMENFCFAVNNKCREVENKSIWLYAELESKDPFFFFFLSMYCCFVEPCLAACPFSSLNSTTAFPIGAARTRIIHLLQNTQKWRRTQILHFQNIHEKKTKWEGRHFTVHNLSGAVKMRAGGGALQRALVILCSWQRSSMGGEIFSMPRVGLNYYSEGHDVGSMMEKVSSALHSY